MRRNIPVLLAILVVVALATACGSGSTAAPTTPTTQTVTETFTGALSQHGSATFPFVAQAGTITATLSSLGDNSTISVGLAVGTWDGTVCTPFVSNNRAQISTVVTATVSASTNLCAQAYDVGNLTASTTLPFTVTIVHP